MKRRRHGPMNLSFSKCCKSMKPVYTKTGECWDCTHEREYSNNPEYREKWDKGVKEDKAKISQKQKDRRELNPEKYKETARQSYLKRKDTDYYKRTNREARLKREYGMSIEDYEYMYTIQTGKCKICLKEKKGDGKDGLVVDHDHDTGVVRGLLCGSCNIYISRIDKDLDVIKRLQRYFEYKRK